MGRITIEEMQRIAKKRGGKCLSKTYIGGRNKLTWQCSKGHVWDATGQSIKHQKSWCPKCAGRIHDIPFMQRLAKKKGGLCLSKKFVSVMKKLTWQCAKGHKWDATPSNIKHNGHWCPICARNRYTVDDMQSFAKKYKGVCLSKNVAGYGEQVKWKCANGHTFSASRKYISRRLHFCSKCKVNSVGLSRPLIKSSYARYRKAYFKAWYKKMYYGNKSYRKKRIEAAKKWAKDNPEKFKEGRNKRYLTWYAIDDKFRKNENKRVLKYHKMRQKNDAAYRKRNSERSASIYKTKMKNVYYRLLNNLYMQDYYKKQ